MARLNIEDHFWIEVMPLALKLSDQDKAIGMAIRFFRLAQEKHKHGKFISEAEFHSYGFSEDMIGTFAERTEYGIRAVGADKHFNWLQDRVEAGRAGGIVSSERKKKAAAIREHNKSTSKTKQDQASDTFARKAQPSSSSSSSISNSSSKKYLSAESSDARSAETHVFEPDELISEYLKSVKQDIQQGWLSLYQDREWITRELKAAVIWMKSNPHKAPKSQFSRFFSNWLKNGWERFRKTQSSGSRAGQGINWNEVFPAQKDAL